MADQFDLECRNVVKKFDAFTAVNDISLAIPKGSFFSILGPSGCGKTTLLRMLAGFQAPTSGDILIKGSSVLGVPPNPSSGQYGFSASGTVPDDECR